MKELMQAAVINKYGQELPELKQVPVPTVGPQDVLVKVMAASINPVDFKINKGELKMLLHFDLPFIMGNDFAGEVVQVGAAVKQYAVGDAVYGRTEKERMGAFAEYVAVDQAVLALKPAQLSFEEAAALPLVGLTSYQALHDVMALQPGQKVLIQGGAGGVGTVAIQIAKSLGAFVATTASPKNFELVKQLGADQVIDYHTTDFTEVLTDYDAVFDTRGGQALKDAFKIVRPGGNVVSISGLPNARFGKAFGLPKWKQVLFALVTRPLKRLEKQTQATYTFLFMAPSGEQLAVLNERVAAGALKPILDHVVPLADINTALQYVQKGHAQGKIVLKIATA